MHSRRPVRSRAVCLTPQPVKRFLVRNGVEAHRLVVRGYGEALPMGTNRTEAGRWQNRRVEIIILEVGR